MATITLRTVPEDLHRKIKRLQLDFEDKGDTKSLEQVYLYLIEKALQTEKPSK